MAFDERNNKKKKFTSTTGMKKEKDQSKWTREIL